VQVVATHGVTYDSSHFIFKHQFFSLKGPACFKPGHNIGSVWRCNSLSIDAGCWIRKKIFSIPVSASIPLKNVWLPVATLHWRNIEIPALVSQQTLSPIVNYFIVWMSLPWSLLPAVSIVCWRCGAWVKTSSLSGSPLASSATSWPSYLPPGQGERCVTPEPTTSCSSVFLHYVNHHWRMWRTEVIFLL